MCRAPYGARGLKYPGPESPARIDESRPVWGAWIEIVSIEDEPPQGVVAPRMGRVD